MTIYEILSLTIAFLALGASLRALYVSTRLQRTQLQEIDEIRAQRKKGDVRVSLVRTGRGERFVVSNVGQGEAHDVRLKIVPQKGKSDPLPQGEYDEKFPVSVLRPDQRIELVAALTLDSGVVFSVKLDWRNEDGSLRTVEDRVSLLSA